VSEADLLLTEIGQEALAGYMIGSSRRGERARAAGVTAAELMTSPAVTVDPDDTLAVAASLMHDRRVRRLPVVDQAGRLVGIVSRVDLLSVYDQPDEEIRDRVIKEVIAGDFALGDQRPVPHRPNASAESLVAKESWNWKICGHGSADARW
jgi:CBS domain-containing protein